MRKETLTARLAEVKKNGLYRHLRAVEGAQDAAIILEGQEVLLFSSNNYLGLANHPALKQAAQEAIAQYGCGSGASRLISGSMADPSRVGTTASPHSKKQKPPLFFRRVITPISGCCPP